MKDISLGWVLELCHRYPTARRLAAACADDIGNITYLPHERIDALLRHARASVASLEDDIVAELVREQVRQMRDTNARQKRLENALVSAYHALPEANQLESIPGIGDVSAGPGSVSFRVLFRRATSAPLPIVTIQAT